MIKYNIIWSLRPRGHWDRQRIIYSPH